MRIDRYLQGSFLYSRMLSTKFFWTSMFCLELVWNSWLYCRWRNAKCLLPRSGSRGVLLLSQFGLIRWTPEIGLRLSRFLSQLVNKTHFGQGFPFRVGQLLQRLLRSLVLPLAFVSCCCSVAVCEVRDLPWFLCGRTEISAYFNWYIIHFTFGES